MSKRIRDEDEAAAETARGGQGQRRYKVHLEHVLNGEERDILIDASL